MRWVVFGARGFVGSEIVRHLCAAGQEVVVPAGRVSCEADVRAALAAHAPVDRVVCTLGRTHGGGVNSIDYLETGEGAAANVRDNLLAPLSVARATAGVPAAATAAIPVLYIGTGCIYAYDVAAVEAAEAAQLGAGAGAVRAFDEEDVPNFTGSAYSAVKAATDAAMAAFPHVLNARIRMPITAETHPRDFITKVLGYERLTSLPNSMTVLDDVLPRLLALAHVGGVGGALNAVNRGAMSHGDIVAEWVRASGAPHLFEPESYAAQCARLAAPRSNNLLACDRFDGAMSARVTPDVARLYGLTGEARVPLLRESVSRVLAARAVEPSAERSGAERSSSAESNSNAEPRRLLVTGGCGFIGSAFVNHVLAQWALRSGRRDTVVNVDRLDACASVNNVVVPPEAAAGGAYTLVVGDVGNRDLMLHVLRQHRVTHIVHFAAESHVDKSFGNSMAFTQSNVLGTHGLLEAARAYREGGAAHAGHGPGDLRLFLHISTDEVYGEVPHGACTEETSVLAASNPYAATKAAAEFLVRSYGASFKLPFLITRGNNVYGPRQFPEKVVPRFITRLLAGQKMQVQGDGSARRMFLHVDDTVAAVALLLERGEVGRIYNIGSPDEHSVLDVARAVLALVKPGAALEEWLETVPDRAFNDCRYSVDTRALEALGWRRRVGWAEGLAATVAWYRGAGEPHGPFPPPGETPGRHRQLWV